MKQKLIAGLTMAALALAPASVGLAQSPCPPASPYFTNSTTYIIPGNNGNIDAGSFVNTKSGQFAYAGSPFLWFPYNATNFVNWGTMSGFPGFDFENWSSCSGQASMAANFVNQPQGNNSGVISCSGYLSVSNVSGMTEAIYSGLMGSSKLIVSAKNITNSGTIYMDASSRIAFTGNNVDLSYGGVTMSTPYSQSIFGTNVGLGVYSAGILDGYWNATNATSGFTPSSMANNLTTPSYQVMPRTFMPYNTSISLQRASQQGSVPLMYYNDTGVVNSNRFVQVAFVYNADTNFSSAVYFPGNQIAVQWQYVTTNWPDKSLTTNYMVLTDNFGERTNIQVRVNGRVNPQSGYAPPTYMPVNYNLYVGQMFSTILASAPAFTALPPTVLDNIFVTNQFTAYQAIFTSASELPQDVAYFNVTNLGGRMEVNANNLNLKRARLQALNYLLLSATNHFAGSPGAQIGSPNADIYLRATNGSMVVSNLMAPFLPHAAGNMFFWSGRWTNVVTTGAVTVTNGFHVLFVDNELSPVTTPLLQNLDLTVTNSAAPNTPGDLVISDALNVSSNFMFSARSVTITTNDPNAFVAFGQINMIGTSVIGPTNFPNVLYLTNWGQFFTLNQINLGAAACPLQTLVNHGTLFAGGYSQFGYMMGMTYMYSAGLSITAKQIVSDGILGGLGSVDLQEADCVALSNNLLYAYSGGLEIDAGSLLVSNELVYADGPIDLWITNNLSDGGGGPLVNAGYWEASGIINLHRKPLVGDLLSTTIYDTGPDYMQCQTTWAGEDRGACSAGFSNNCAVGHLVLSAGSNTIFNFSAVGQSNALYVDEIEFVNYATNRSFQGGDYTSIQIDPNMKIYYAQAIVNGGSVAEKLNGKNNGGFVWVPSYAGFFSGTNLLYPDGNTYTFNKALVESSDIDSDHDGIVNRSDSTPVFVPSMLNFTAFPTNHPQPAVCLTWKTIGFATNYVYYATSLGASNSTWRLLTNFPTGYYTGAPLAVRVFDTMTSSNRFYGLRVDPQQP